MSRFALIKNDFYPEAAALRGHFDERFADPRSARGDRFVWDYWYVPDQYCHLRTPAWEYFPEPMYRAFHEHLVRWGRRVLGCWDISPPWLSAYIEGCEQHLHSDVPHGPWAFVFSISPGGRPAFQGGETLILKAATLDYWSSFSELEDRERGSLVERIAPRHNRLVVFDPRFPHGVTRVSGVRDPRLGRLVIHGWFTEPRPFIEGPLSQSQVDAVLEDALGGLAEDLVERGPFHGLLSLRLQVSAAGSVVKVETLANTLILLEAPGAEVRSVLRLVQRRMRALSFPRRGRPSEITLPLLFR